jgi:plasmid maintenance system antidote protein VapI
MSKASQPITINPNFADEWAELAARTGLVEDALSRIIGDEEDIPLSMIFRLANALGMKVRIESPPEQD